MVRSHGKWKCDRSCELLAVDTLSDFLSEITIVRSMNNTTNVLSGQEMDSLVSEVIIYFDSTCFSLDSSLHFGVQQTGFIFRNDTHFEGSRIHIHISKNSTPTTPLDHRLEEKSLVELQKWVDAGDLCRGGRVQGVQELPQLWLQQLQRVRPRIYPQDDFRFNWAQLHPSLGSYWR